MHTAQQPNTKPSPSLNTTANSPQHSPTPSSPTPSSPTPSSPTPSSPTPSSPTPCGPSNSLPAHLYLHTTQLAWGQIRHQRKHPKPNGFAAGACFVRLVFKAGPPTTPLPTFPVIDGKGLVAVCAADYGPPGHGLSLGQLAAQHQQDVAQHTGLGLSGEVHLQTFPKTLGYVFNPVSFWFFHDLAKTCRAILCEVNNTFGERHFYLLTAPEGAQAGLDQGMLLVAQKQFHVSPFFPVSGHYEFRFMQKGNQTLACIHYWNEGQLQLTTSVSGTLMHPSARLWCRTLVKYGWFSMAVILKIHWQAVKLWCKGARFYRKPSPPKQPMTQNDKQS